ncbi:MAG TPA: C1 family peptidase, partial [Labilithrix sp.]
AGQDVIVTIELAETFVPKGKAGAQYIPDYKDAAPNSGHATVLAGYAALPHATYFLIHNSWGPAWGDAGFAWIHEATLRAHVKEALVIDAEPLDAPSTRPKRQRGETTCTGALVPDSISGACSQRCPDGSPRHDGVCPVAGQCPAAYVNLTGQCVLAAPTANGADRDVSWRCGPGGCTWTVPKKLDAQCTGTTCLVSCPAPEFRVARVRTSGTLTCVE